MQRGVCDATPISTQYDLAPVGPQARQRSRRARARVDDVGGQRVDVLRARRAAAVDHVDESAQQRDRRPSTPIAVRATQLGRQTGPPPARTARRCPAAQRQDQQARTRPGRRPGCRDSAAISAPTPNVIEARKPIWKGQAMSSQLVARTRKDRSGATSPTRSTSPTPGARTRRRRPRRRRWKTIAVDACRCPVVVEAERDEQQLVEHGHLHQREVLVVRLEEGSRVDRGASPRVPAPSRKTLVPRAAWRKTIADATIITASRANGTHRPRRAGGVGGPASPGRRVAAHPPQDPLARADRRAGASRRSRRRGQMVLQEDVEER